MSDPNKVLAVSEHFFSVQGEGITCGQRAVFLRLKGCVLNCVWCLGGNTYILSRRGKIRLSEVKTGDFVWGFNEKTLKPEFTEVTNMTSHEAPRYLTIQLDSKDTRQNRIQATGEHPFWVVNRGWVQADKLAVGDVILEMDKSAHCSVTHTGRKQPESAKRKASARMSANNPMKRPEVVAKVAAYWKAHPELRPNALKELWKKPSFRKLVSNRMRTDNPMFDPLISAKSANRPFGQVSRLERFVARIIDRLGLPVLHNKGRLYIDRRVPDFVVHGKKKVIEVTHPTFMHREKEGYAQKNRVHYGKSGYACLTLYVKDFTAATAQRIAYDLVNFVHNGKTVTKIRPWERPLKVFNLTTKNHTFFANGVLTHNCDTVEVWKQGVSFTVEELTGKFADLGYLRALFDDEAHLVLTGGDPLMQQAGIIALFNHWDELCYPGRRLYVEVETEGVLQPKAELAPWVTQWNVSPKLANSGMPLNRRFNRKVLSWHVEQGNSWFKFPVATLADCAEALELSNAAGIPRNQILFMPVCASRQEFEERAADVAKWAMQCAVRFSPRLHLTIWDRSTGV